ncbi:alpha/beta hydrolase [Streptomyces sp. 1-11]|uniref:alpha/beta hydrolase n=1 Tax=Streptomyces sp. 1-11 TaxID=2590549 RepID=UPI0035A2E76F
MAQRPRSGSRTAPRPAARRGRSSDAPATHAESRPRHAAALVTARVLSITDRSVVSVGVYGTYPRNRCVAEKVDHCLRTGRTPAPGTVCRGSMS